MSANPPVPGGECVLYTSDDGRVRLTVRLHDGTVWLSQRLIAELFEITVPTVNDHLGNIYDEGELDPGATIRKFRIVQTEGALVEQPAIALFAQLGYENANLRGEVTKGERLGCSQLSHPLTEGHQNPLLACRQPSS